MNKGIVFRKYGLVTNLELTDLPEPQSVEKSHAIVKIDAIGLNPRDISIVEGKFKFLTGKNFPKLIGADFSGQIVRLPTKSEGFEIGDQVFGYFESLKGGVSAQLCAIPLKYLVHQPSGIDNKAAAGIGCTYLTAYQALHEKASVTKGDKVIIYGASGGVGTAAIHIAKSLGAKVTAVSHSRNQEYCLHQGADHFIAHDRQNVFDSNSQYDLFFQVFSDKGNLYSKGKKIVKKNGLYMSLIPNPFSTLLGFFKKPKADYILVKSNKNHLMQIAEWIHSGNIKPHVDQVYELDKYDQAYKHMKDGKIKGKAVISMKE